ncbi:MAG: hypothetical protein WKF94_09035 [Solirubrobacteraceae bacterium]
MTGSGVTRRLHRELRMRASSRRLARGLAAASRDDRPVVVGPFLGEVGFEVLYWLPMARWLLERHGIDRTRVVALTRGGAGRWYEDFAAAFVDVYDLFDPTVAETRLARRRSRVRDQKQLTIDRLDREIVQAAGTHGAFVLHPLIMFAAHRDAWAGQAPLEEVTQRAVYRPIPTGAPEGLPGDYVAVRIYFSNILPDTPAVRERLERLTATLTLRHDLVIIQDSVGYDGHPSWIPQAQNARVRIAEVGEARRNLDQQARLIADAHTLVTTYGGIAHLAPFVGVPSVALFAERVFNERHLDVTRVAASRLGAPAPRVLNLRESLTEADAGTLVRAAIA